MKEPRHEAGFLSSQVGHTGLEPVTSCVSYKRASQLRQWPGEINFNSSAKGMMRPTIQQRALLSGAEGKRGMLEHDLQLPIIAPHITE